MSTSRGSFRVAHQGHCELVGEEQLWVFENEALSCYAFPSGELLVSKPMQYPAQLLVRPAQSRGFLRKTFRKVIEVVDTRTLKRVASLKAHTKDVDWIALSSDGARLVSAGQDRRICVWDTDTHALLHSWKLPKPNTPNRSQRVYELGFVGEGAQRIYARAEDTYPQPFSIWSIDTQTLLFGCEAPVDAVLERDAALYLRFEASSEREPLRVDLDGFASQAHAWPEPEGVSVSKWWGEVLTVRGGDQALAHLLGPLGRIHSYGLHHGLQLIYCLHGEQLSWWSLAALHAGEIPDAGVNRRVGKLQLPKSLTAAHKLGLFKAAAAATGLSTKEARKHIASGYITAASAEHARVFTDAISNLPAVRVSWCE